MLVPTKLATVHYDMHEPYNYTRLWEILRAEGLKNDILSMKGVRKKLPDSMWAVELPGVDPLAMSEQLLLRLDAAVKAAGISADLFVLVSDGWAWSAADAAPAQPRATLAALNAFSLFGGGL